jgi:hypothetical protein
MKKEERIKFETYDGRVAEGTVIQRTGHFIRVQDDETKHLHVIDERKIIEKLPDVRTPKTDQIGRR